MKTRGWFALLVVVWTSVGLAQAAPRRVLLLYSYEREFAPSASFTDLFLPELSRTSKEPVELIEVSLQAARLNSKAPDDSLTSLVQSMLAGRRPDLVVPIGGPAVKFAQRNRAELFPEAAMLLAGVDGRFVKKNAVGPNDTAVTVDHEPERLVQNILTVLPDTNHVFVVVGASHHERVWLDELKRAFAPFQGRVTFSWGNELSFAEMLARCGSLPPRSAILYAILSLDAKGIAHIEDRALAQLRAAANAPLFGVRSTQLGRGIVGGPLLSIEDMSRNTAAVAIRLLEGEPASRVSTPTQGLAAPTFDGRELRRWGIDEDRLPPGSTVMFREPTTWQRYRIPIVTLGAIAGLQVILVIALVANLTKRRRAEQRLRESEGRLELLSNTAPMMLWVSGPDKLCTDFNRPWLEFTGRSMEAELGNGWAEGVHPDDLERCVEIYHSAFDRREPFRMEYRLRRHDGEYRWVLDTGVARFLSDGTFAGYVGSALDVTDLRLARNALASLSQRLMQDHEQERATVAKELQDGLCQRMIMLTMQLHGLSRPPIDGDEEHVRGRVADVSRQLADLAHEIFAIPDQLYSSNLKLLGLVAAGRIFCNELSAQHDVIVDFREEGMPADVPNDVALALFRVLQEALRNAVKHAGVRRVAVSLRGTFGGISLEVADEGVGFDAETVMKSEGLGLIAMRERLRLVGGDCTVESRPGEGTRIRARVPLKTSDARASVA
jgi:PAS domain S-box-containing protein